MGVKRITFPTYFKYYSLEEYPSTEDILEEDDILDDDDIENSHIDVFVELDDGYTYNVEVATAKNLDYFMDLEQRNYLGPTYPTIIVRKLTREIIQETITAYAEKNDGYWLKLYHFAANIDETVFKKLQAEHEEDLKELDDELDNS
jgi:hypothetical protein